MRKCFEWMANLSLRAKIVMILSAVVLGYAACDLLVQRFVIYESFVALEQHEAERNLQRVVQAIGNEQAHLDTRCDDWATSDETWRFAADGNAEYVRSNLSGETFHKNKLDLLFVCNESGRVVWGKSIDLATDKPLHFHDFPEQALASGHPLLEGLERSGAAGGLMMTEHGPLLVSARPILDSARHGPRRGAVILGQLLTEEHTAELANQTGVHFKIWPIASSDLPAGEQEVRDAVTASSEPVLRSFDAEHLRAYTSLSDIRQAPAILLCADLDRAISAQGMSALRYALISTIAAGLLMMLALLFLLQKAVLEPIAALTAHAVEIGRSEELTQRLLLDRADEVGVLSREFDGMVGKLAHSRAEVVKAARAAGMSEIATGVLHNVGNMLNSVNVSASVIARTTRSSALADLARVIETVHASAADLKTFLVEDPRGVHFEPLISSLANQLLAEQRSVTEELASLETGIEHILELIAAQQSHAGRAGVLEPVRIAQEIENVLALTEQISGGRKLEIVREFEELAAVPLDRHRLIEILVNVVQNARQALANSSVVDPKLHLRLERLGEDGVRIQVIDSGVGIAPENIARVFTHGFTTKAEGHGFGLHSSANAATEMGGTLRAHSDGPGRGATFTLEIPFQRVRAAAVGGRSS